MVMPLEGEGKMLSAPEQYPDERVSTVTDIRGASYRVRPVDPWWFHPAAERYVRGDEMQGPLAGSRAHGLPTGERVEQMQP